MESRQLRPIMAGIASGSDPPKAVAIVYRSASEHHQVTKHPSPEVYFEEFGNNALNLGLYHWVDLAIQLNRCRIMNTTRHRREALFTENGIAIPFPQRDVHLDMVQPFKVELNTASSGAFASSRRTGKMTRYRAYISLCLIGACGCLMANADEHSSNVGQDFTRPLGRVDLRWTYQNRVENNEYDETALRLEQPFRLSERWTFNTRFNLPGIYKNLPKPGEHEWGLGDLDIQTALIRQFTERYSLGGGVRTIMPTASEERFGAGKYRLLVGGGLRAMLPEIGSGSFIAPQLQYDFDVAGDKARDGIKRLRILPTLNVGLPQDQFLTFLSSGDLRYDFNTQKWFVPIDVTYGKRWNNFITSLQAAYPIVDDMQLYEFKTELRVGYFF